MACEHQIEMPITKALYEILYEEKSPALALAELMGRDIKNLKYHKIKDTFNLVIYIL